MFDQASIVFDCNQVFFNEKKNNNNNASIDHVVFILMSAAIGAHQPGALLHSQHPRLFHTSTETKTQKQEREGVLGLQAYLTNKRLPEKQGKTTNKEM